MTLDALYMYRPIPIGHIFTLNTVKDVLAPGVHANLLLHLASDRLVEIMLSSYLSDNLKHSNFYCSSTVYYRVKTLRYVIFTLFNLATLIYFAIVCTLYLSSVSCIYLCVVFVLENP